ncbi:MAG: DM13 domain-containing protein, partial [Gemmatimonadetes bacterium]|nr:DM13 domain-containing protein [Gemmatimonadota bacterium]
MAYHNIVCARTSRAVRILALAALAGCQATPVGTAAGLANPVTTDELRRQASPQLVATGRFVSKGGESTSGTYRIERVSGDLRLVLEPDFETSKGPDLHVVLSPVDVAAAGNRNVMPKGQARVLGELR